MRHYIYNVSFDIMAEDEQSANNAVEWVLDHGASGDYGGYADSIDFDWNVDGADVMYEDDLGDLEWNDG